jgi:hypothetical protein
MECTPEFTGSTAYLTSARQRIRRRRRRAAARCPGVVRLLATERSIHATASSAVAAAFARSRAVSSTVVRGGVMAG